MARLSMPGSIMLCHPRSYATCSPDHGLHLQLFHLQFSKNNVQWPLVIMAAGLQRCCRLAAQRRHCSCTHPAVPWQERILEVMGSMKAAGLPFGARKDEPRDMEYYPFKRDKEDYGVYWDTRKGLIPIVGGARETGAASTSTRLCYATMPCNPWPTCTLDSRLAAPLQHACSLELACIICSPLPEGDLPA